MSSIPKILLVAALPLPLKRHFLAIQNDTP